MRTAALGALIQLAPLATARADWASAGLADLSIRAVVRTSSGLRFAAAGEGLYRSLDGGATWTRFETDQFGDAFTALVHPDSNLLFVSAESGTYRSADDGASWVHLGDGIAGTHSLAVAPNQDLYASGGFGTFRSTDRGLNWAPIEPTPGSFTDGLAIDPDGRVFLRPIIFGTLLRSADHGLHWVELIPSPEYASTHAVSPLTGTVLVGTQTFTSPGMVEVYRSTDHGDSWQRVLHLPGSMDALHFLGNGDALAGVGSVLHSTDDGLTWTPRNAGLPPALQVECFTEIHGVVFAGMKFGGLWREDQLVVSVPPAAPAAMRELRLTATPSPFSARTSLRFTLPGAAAVTLDVFDVQGKRQARLTEGWYPAGPHDISFEARALPAGLYFARLSAGAAGSMVRLLVLR